MATPQVIFRRKGTRVIYPYTEANAKNPSLISMSVSDAQDEGLLGPRDEHNSDSAEVSQLKSQNEVLRAKLDELLREKKEADAPPKKVAKKKVSKKKAVKAVEPEPEQVQVEMELEVEDDEDSELKDSLSKLGIQMDS